MVNFGGTFLSPSVPLFLPSLLFLTLYSPFHVLSPSPSPPPHTHTHTHTHTLKHIKGLLPVWVLEQLQKLLNEPLASLTINLPLGRTRYSLRPTLNGLWTLSAESEAQHSSLDRWSVYRVREKEEEWREEGKKGGKVETWIGCHPSSVSNCFSLQMELSFRNLYSRCLRGSGTMLTLCLPGRWRYIG